MRWREGRREGGREKVDGTYVARREEDERIVRSMKEEGGKRSKKNIKDKHTCSR